jgi:exopolyphosphatase/guanosine-5'-triphosphate,3'-diphosphate pyrophosphatase
MENGVLRMLNKEELLLLSNVLWDESRSEYKLCRDEEEYKDIMDYRQLHSKIVADLAIKMFDDYYDELFKKDEFRRMGLYFGCLTHDIKKIDEDHHIKGAEFIENSLISKDYDIRAIKCFSKIVEYHKAKKEKKKDDKYMEEISNLDNEMKTLILFSRISDKLSKFVYKSKYKRITEKNIDQKMKEIIGKSHEFIWDEEKLIRVFDLVKTQFKVKYCNKQIEKNSLEFAVY